MTKIKANDIIAERPKPTLYLYDRDLKEIKNWAVGKKYKLKLTVKMTRASDSDSDYDKGFSGDFKVLKVEKAE